MQLGRPAADLRCIPNQPMPMRQINALVIQPIATIANRRATDGF